MRVFIALGFLAALVTALPASGSDSPVSAVEARNLLERQGCGPDYNFCVCSSGEQKCCVCSKKISWDTPMTSDG
ncbi:hypothetical protein BGZ63DRAFT_387260 [Mariannaea sp. PMI_226]|nr:hypothetical protein BGZ63DRAFT_387260 [Mariannaea sp. PMI_226]